METRVEKTIEKHDKGYNCAQAVACSFCREFGIDGQPDHPVIITGQLDGEFHPFAAGAFRPHIFFILIRR